MNRIWKKRIQDICIGLILAVTLLLGSVHTVFADTELPEGTAAGLPDGVTILDSDGNAANSDTGEYFFHVLDMVQGENYSKKIQIMNLREDKAYHIYFYAEPIDKNGTIDLEEECEEVLSMNGSELYRGKVNEGDTIDLGLYEPGVGRTLVCNIIWNGSEAEMTYDNGAKTVDANGTTVTREAEGENSAYGEIYFRWVFYAAVDEEYTPPKTGIWSGSNLLEIGILATIICMILVLLVLLHKKKKKKKIGKSTVVTISALFLVCLALGGGFTVAYLKQKDSVTNRFQATDVEIQLWEPNWYATGQEKAKTMQPGQTIEKDPQVYNSSEQAVYVRMKLVLNYGEDASEELADAMQEENTADSKLLYLLDYIYMGTKKTLLVSKNADGTYSSNNGSFYLDEDGWFYYISSLDTDGKPVYGTLEGGATTPTLFDTVAIPIRKSDYNVLFQDGFQLEVVAQAIAVSDQYTTSEEIKAAFADDYKVVEQGEEDEEAGN